ncbi:MAG TPA: hypothetical protein VGO47_06545 [Chlamydiales bacterium]|nr:hypothetical protein [Chlamydiales bacterium]
MPHWQSSQRNLSGASWLSDDRRTPRLLTALIFVFEIDIGQQNTLNWRRVWWEARQPTIDSSFFIPLFLALRASLKGVIAIDVQVVWPLGAD